MCDWLNLQLHMSHVIDFQFLLKLQMAFCTLFTAIVCRSFSADSPRWPERHYARPGHALARRSSIP